MNDDIDRPWWPSVLGAIACAAVGVYLFHRLAGLERDGGSLRTFFFVSSIYHVAGKCGVLGALLAGAAALLVFGVRQRMAAGSVRNHDRGNKP